MDLAEQTDGSLSRADRRAPPVDEVRVFEGLDLERLPDVTEQALDEAFHLREPGLRVDACGGQETDVRARANPVADLEDALRQIAVLVQRQNTHHAWEERRPHLRLLL